MSRHSRIVIPSWVHHATQRGNHQQTVFFSAQDRTIYLNLLEKYFGKYGIRLVGYCLMSNHVHLVVIPEQESSLSDGIGQLHHDFSQWQNIQCVTNGHLWQNRFYSSPVEEDRIWEVLDYVESNPVRACMVKHAWEWAWAGSQAHVTGHDSSGLLDVEIWRKIFTAEKWKNYLGREKEDGSIAAKIRHATIKGHFLGKDETARRLEKELGKQLLSRKRGRKPKG